MNAPHAAVPQQAPEAGSLLARVQLFCMSRERVLLFAIVGLAATLRIALVVGSPTPYGYVYDFYQDAVAYVYDHRALPPPSACWICAHPPLFWIVGAPFYAFGMLISHQQRAVAERILCLLPLLCDAVVATYTYRLLRLYRQRGLFLLSGMALCLLFPCLVISSHAPESDILLTALMVAGLFHVTRLHLATDRAAWSDALWLGALIGLAALTKYSGILLLVAACAVLLVRAWKLPAERRRTLCQAFVVCALAFTLGGAKYAYNLRVHHELLFANGPAHAGFDLLGLRARERNYRRYDFTSLRIPAAIELFEPAHASGVLTDQPVYFSVWTTLHSMAWTDMSMFSVHSRHGDPSRPYPSKHLPIALVAALLYLGLVPTVLACVGCAVSWRRTSVWPLSWFALTSLSAYAWWFVAQDEWALKTKYILFLLPVYVLFFAFGLQRVMELCSPLGRAAASVTLGALVALAITCTIYLGRFALS